MPEKDPVSLGYTNIGNNAKAGQGSAGTVGVGMDPGTADTSSSTTDMSEPTSDTQIMAFDGSGTVTTNGING